MGGRAAEYPASYVVFKILEKHGLLGTVLDVTYGKGRFYHCRKPDFLIGADPKVWEWVVVPDVFIPRPVWQLKRVLERINVKPDVIVCDPPQWNRDVHYHSRNEYSYLLGSPEQIIEEAVKLAKELGTQYFLLHYNRRIRMDPVDEVEFRYVARFLNNPDLRTTFFSLYQVLDL